MIPDKYCSGCNQILPYDYFPIRMNNFTGEPCRANKCRKCAPASRRHLKLHRDFAWREIDPLPDDKQMRRWFVAMDNLVIGERDVIGGHVIYRDDNTSYTVDDKQEISGSTVRKAIEAVIEYLQNGVVHQYLSDNKPGKRQGGKPQKFGGYKSRFHGVYQHPGRSRWYAKILVDRRTVSLGGYETEIQAAMAYNDAVIERRMLNKPLNQFTQDELVTLGRIPAAESSAA